MVGKSDAPSCQAYNIPSRAVEGRKWIMGMKLEKQSVMGSARNDAPGPGNYDPNYRNVIQSLPKFSIKGRYKNQKPAEVPGPGAYSSNFFSN